MDNINDDMRQKEVSGQEAKDQIKWEKIITIIVRITIRIT